MKQPSCLMRRLLRNLKFRCLLVVIICLMISDSQPHKSGHGITGYRYSDSLFNHYFDGGVRECSSLFAKLIRPVDTDKLNEQIPSLLYEQYTFYDVIEHNRFYFDDAHGVYESHWTVNLLNEFQRNQPPNTVGTASYPFHSTSPFFDQYHQTISGKRGVVIGSLKPWAEAMLLNANASHITTVEYATIKSDHPMITTMKPHEWSANFLEGGVELYDWAFTYSSLEHDGLGRYGDPLNPFGDLESMRRLHCHLKPGGYLFIGIPSGLDYLSWNAHRVYGYLRLAVLFQGWKLVDVVGPVGLVNDMSYGGSYTEPIWVLQKTDDSVDESEERVVMDNDGSARTDQYYYYHFFNRLGSLLDSKDPTRQLKERRPENIAVLHKPYEFVLSAGSPLGDSPLVFIFLLKHAVNAGLMKSMCAKRCTRNREAFASIFPENCTISLCLHALQYVQHVSLAEESIGLSLDSGIRSSLLATTDYFLRWNSLGKAGTTHEINVSLKYLPDDNDDTHYSFLIDRGDLISAETLKVICWLICSRLGMRHEHFPVVLKQVSEKVIMDLQEETKVIGNQWAGFELVLRTANVM